MWFAVICPGRIGVMARIGSTYRVHPSLRCSYSRETSQHRIIQLQCYRSHNSNNQTDSSSELLNQAIA